jgi:hypothetical protein
MLLYIQMLILGAIAVNFVATGSWNMFNHLKGASQGGSFLFRKYLKVSGL